MSAVGVNLRSADLSMTRVSGGDFTDAIFEGSDLTGAWFGDGVRLSRESKAMLQANGAQVADWLPSVSVPVEREEKDGEERQ